MECYFVKYRWRKVGSEEWNHVNDVIKHEPITMLMNLRANFGDKEEYILDFYHVIDEEFHERYVNEIS